MGIIVRNMNMNNFSHVRLGSIGNSIPKEVLPLGNTVFFMLDANGNRISRNGVNYASPINVLTREGVDNYRVRFDTGTNVWANATLYYRGDSLQYDIPKNNRLIERPVDQETIDVSHISYYNTNRGQKGDYIDYIFERGYCYYFELMTNGYVTCT